MEGPLTAEVGKRIVWSILDKRANAATASTGPRTALAWENPRNAERSNPEPLFGDTWKISEKKTNTKASKSGLQTIATKKNTTADPTIRTYPPMRTTMRRKKWMISKKNLLPHPNPRTTRKRS